MPDCARHLPSHVPVHAPSAAKPRGSSGRGRRFTAETDSLLEESGFELLVPLVDAGLFGRKREFANDVAGSGNDADRIRVAPSRRRAPLLKCVEASEQLSAGYVPSLERSGGTEGSNPVPSRNHYDQRTKRPILSLFRSDAPGLRATGQSLHSGVQRTRSTVKLAAPHRDRSPIFFRDRVRP